VAGKGDTTGYWSLLRYNRRFRRLWFAQVVSLGGDWFRLIALYHLILQLTGTSGLALGGVMIAQTLAMFLFSPVAGVVADRFSRKTIMIVADLVRALLACGFLLLTSAAQLWLAYGLTAAIMAVSSFFHPAYVSTIPNLARREELVTANALSSATWAVMLALGSGLGGLVTSALGIRVAFVIDALSYVASAGCIAAVQIPYRSIRETMVEDGTPQSGWHNFVQGMRYLRRHPHVLRLLSVKAWSVGIGGGMVLLLTLFAETVFQAGVSGLGVIYMVRGIGAAAGPIIARRLLGEAPETLFRTIGFAFLIMGGLYMVFSRMPTLWYAAMILCVATMAANVLWVFSSTLLQLSVPDAYRGRVFAADFALFTILMSASTLITGWALDDFGLGARTLALVFGGILLLPGLLWLATLRGPGFSVLPAEHDQELAERPRNL
jgi:predicted MFS family arabinose efflux permease